MQHINTFTNETILYDDRTHSYYSPDGRRLMGASSYANKFGDVFNKENILPKLATKWDMSVEDIDDLWRINAAISNSYGTAIHAAMEAWFKYHEHGERIKNIKGDKYNYCLPKNDYIRNIVLDFVNTFGDLNGIPEAVLSNIKKGMAGRTDLLVITGENECRVADFKTNNDMKEDKLVKYQNQLSFYADMLVEAGWTVPGLDIYYHNGEQWECIPMDVLPIELGELPIEQLSTQFRRRPAFKGV